MNGMVSRHYDTRAPTELRSYRSDQNSTSIHELHAINTFHILTATCLCMLCAFRSTLFTDVAICKKAIWQDFVTRRID